MTWERDPRPIDARRIPDSEDPATQTAKDLAEEMGQRLLTLMRSGDAVAGVDLLDELVDTYGPDVARELFVEGMAWARARQATP